MGISKVKYLEMLELFEQHIGDRGTDLVYKNPYTFAVAVLLSAQTTDKSVNIATRELFELADNPAEMLRLGQEELKNHIKRLGFFNVKVKHIMEMSKLLLEKFDGILPKTRDELMELSGIGRKSANVILNELYNTSTIGVDTHVMRLVKRLGIVDDGISTPEAIEAELDRITPDKYKPFISNYLVLFGRYECKAKNPNCAACYVQKFCKVIKNEKN